MWPFTKREPRIEWENLGVARGRDDVLLHLIKATQLYSPRITLRDGKLPFRCLHIIDFQTLIDLYRKPDPPYVLEKFDCDDSADTFVADIKRGWAKATRGKESLCFGRVWLKKVGSKGTHEMNWELDEGGALLFIEPQTNRFYFEPIEAMYELWQ